MSKTIVVLGISRCGSSLILEILRKWGIPIIRESRRNIGTPKGGYNEHPELSSFFRKFLGSWDEPKTEEEYDRRVKTLDRRLDSIFKVDKNIIAFKALQFSLCPNLLKRIPNLHVIVMFREPNSCAESMWNQTKGWRQKGKDKRDIIELWGTHYFRIIRFLSRNEVPYILINFDDLIDNPKIVARKLAKFLDLEENNFPHQIIKEDLRHFKEGES